MKMCLLILITVRKWADALKLQIIGTIFQMNTRKKHPTQAAIEFETLEFVGTGQTSSRTSHFQSLFHRVPQMMSAVLPWAPD